MGDNIYTELIQKLTLQLDEAEERNALLNEEVNVLKIENSNLIGKLEILTSVYEDFKFFIKGGVSPSQDLSVSKVKSSSKPTYNDLLSQYNLNNDVTIVPKLFSEYNKKPTDVITDIRNDLPPDINKLAKRYKCYNELKLLIKSNKKILKVLEVDDFYEYRGRNDITRQYIENYNKNKKSIALKFLKQALLYYPLQFNAFLNDIQAYRYDDLDEHIETFRVELYGKSVIPEKNGEKSSSKPRTDYVNVTIDDLILSVIDQPHSSRQAASRIVEQLLKYERDDAFVTEFKTKANETFNFRNPL